jgi:hypothetical protein
MDSSFETVIYNSFSVCDICLHSVSFLCKGPFYSPRQRDSAWSRAEAQEIFIE